MKEVRDFYNQFDTCRERDIPLCSEACPFKVDIIPLMERITAGRFNAAYKAYRDNVVFPGIVSEICPGYCRDACIRKGFDEALNLPLIEKSIVGLASRRQPNSYNLPDRSARVAVIGSGISGMAFALKMATRKYDVTIFEKEASIGGRLKSLMDESIYMGEFDLQFSNEKYTLLCSTEAQVDISNGAVTAVTGGQTHRFEDFSVVYVATGAETSPDIEAGSPPFIEAGNTGIFYGGSMLGSDTMHALVDGINASAIADSYMKTGIYEAPEAPEPSGCVANEDMLVPTETVHPAASIYSEEECREEASRCIKCKCDACESSCDLVRFYKKWPIKMRDEIFLSVKPAGSLVHKCPSRKYIAACTQCTMLENACPESIDLCGMIKSARHEMHSVDKMPAAYRQYFMRDMAFANGEFAKIVKGGGKYGFFPGCNLGALNPEYVIRSYKWILQQFPDTGLLLRCCGIPADWAGNTERHMEEINQLRAKWTEMGKPVIITACMSCDKHLREYLPEIETVSLYELYAEYLKLPDSRSPSPKSVEPRTFTVFDPCSARGLDSVQEAVRDIAEAHGMRIDEFPKNDQHGCCGYGGQGSIAQPLFAKYVTEERACMSDNPYLVYCSNCRDVFNAEGKEAIHILDVMFDIDSEGTAPVPSLTDRRNNRIILKEALLNEIWGVEMTNKPETSKYQLVMKDDLLAKAERLRILEDDICSVIDYAETTGRRARSPETGHYRAYKEIGAITLWVEYGAGEGNIREIHNIYTHRMQIKLEAVFNGRKTDEQE